MGTSRMALRREMVLMIILMMTHSVMTAVVSCDPPCANGGTCGSSFCMCVEPYTGPSCEFECNQEEYACNSKCIPKTALCDGVIICNAAGDFDADETCFRADTVGLGSNTSYCVPSRYTDTPPTCVEVCPSTCDNCSEQFGGCECQAPNTGADCGDACSDGQFICKSKCINMTSMCDNTTDCTGRNDNGMDEVCNNLINGTELYICAEDRYERHCRYIGLGDITSNSYAKMGSSDKPYGSIEFLTTEWS